MANDRTEIVQALIDPQFLKELRRRLDNHMLRERLLVILASIFAASSARIEYHKELDEWAKQKPFQIIMSWCLKHASAVTVQVIHTQERDSMYHHTAKLLPVFHETSDFTVMVTHYVIKPEDYQKSCMMHQRYRHLLSGNVSSSNSSINHGASNVTFPKAEARQLLCNWSWQDQSPRKKTHGCTQKAVTILLIPDDSTFQAFLDSGGFWCRNEVKVMLIIVVPESWDILCQGTPKKRNWEKSARHILERAWSEDKVLNIFFSAPTSSCIKDYLFAWDPFSKRANKFSGRLKRLKVNAEDPNVDKALSEFIISLKNMNGYPLRVTIFERLPTLLASSDEGLLETNADEMRQLDVNTITGVDGLVLRSLLSCMNFSAQLNPPSDGNLYGWKLRNGTFVGMLGDIAYRRTDFAANGVFLKDYETATATEFTTPINCESICIVVPRAGIIPQWRQIFQCFSPLVWNLLFFNVIIYSLLRHILSVSLRERQPVRRNVLETIIETALIFVSSPQNMPRLNPERILMAFYLLFNLIVIGTFQGTLYKGFTNPDHFKNLETLAELDSSGLLIGTGSPNLLNIFGDEDDDPPTIANLHKKVRYSQENSELGSIDRAALKQNIAAIERKNDLQLAINTKFLDEHGEPVLHIVTECPRTYHLTFMVPSGAFFLPRMNVLLRRMFESGLMAYWYNSTVEFLILKNHYAMAKTLEVRDKTRPFDLKNLQISFIILASGLLLSILVFIGEEVVHRREVSRRKAVPKIPAITRRNHAMSL